MMHPSMRGTMGSSERGPMNPGMMDMDRMALRRMGGNNGMNMNSMGAGFGGNNLSVMDVPSAVFNNDPRMDPQVMNNSMNRFSSAQDMMGQQMDMMGQQMDHMRRMRQMHMQHMGGGPFPMETPSMPSRFGGGGGGGFTQHEMMQYEAMRNRDGFDRQQMMNSIPSYTGSFPGDMSLERMAPGGMGNPDIMGAMPQRGRMNAPGSDMMMMMNGGNMDMMSMNRSGGGPDMLRGSFSERMSRGSIGAADMIGLNRASMGGMGVSGDRTSNWRNELGDQGGAAQGYDNVGVGHDEMKKPGPPDNGDNGF